MSRKLGDLALDNLVHIHEALYALSQADVDASKVHLLIALETAEDLCRTRPGEKKSVQTLQQPSPKSTIDTSDWASFQDSFQLRWPNFLANLLILCENLSRTEVKVCMLISTGRSNKEIAKILGISSKTVENHRGKIRTKLHLVTRQNLDTYLSRLSHTDWSRSTSNGLSGSIDQHTQA
jgi:DNA-binding CsgD family transcriptional regulator